MFISVKINKETSHTHIENKDKERNDVIDHEGHTTTYPYYLY